MTQPQQTIGNTVYRVGQVLKNYTEAAALLDYIHETRWDGEFFESDHTSKSYNILNLNAQDFPVTITALPNPDPVAEPPAPLTREELLGYNPNQKVWFRDADCLVTYAICTSSKGGLYALGIPMFRTEAECRLYHAAVVDGRVFVKGGV